MNPADAGLNVPPKHDRYRSIMTACKNLGNVGSETRMRTLTWCTRWSGSAWSLAARIRRPRIVRTRAESTRDGCSRVQSTPAEEREGRRQVAGEK